MSARAFISGCASLRLSAEERAFFRDARPWGLILFARNCDEPEQIRRLTAEFRDAVGRGDAPVLIDQEGGRVQRLRPPHWTAWPPARAYRALYLDDPRRGLDLVRGTARLIAGELAAVGITVDCLPVADVPQPGAHDIIGDRAYGDSPDEVAEMARAAAEGLLDGGVLPVVKHIPGHGRAGIDSHEGLPVVEADAETLRRVDFAPFAALKDLPMAMTAHVIYTAFDPDRPATLSPVVIGEVIRKEIGFDGLLMTDDLSMGALDGSLRDRTERSLAAGCDMALHCNGRLDEMAEVAAAAPCLEGRAAERADRALDSARTAAPVDVAAIHVELANLC